MLSVADMCGDGVHACGDGAIRVTQLQRAGKQPMTAEVFLRGTRLRPGMRMA